VEQRRIRLFATGSQTGPLLMPVQGPTRETRHDRSIMRGRSILFAQEQPTCTPGPRL
jgi:hypothetical protein